jgi:hypothetical protein
MKRIASFGLTRLGDARTMACIDGTTDVDGTMESMR